MVSMDTTTAASPDATFEILDATDRCDSCRAQAYVLVTLRDTGLPLMFCAHHWSVHSEKLMPLVGELVDETRKLLDR